MFNPKTEKITELAENYPNRILELESIFDRQTNIYIDYANVKPWANKLRWHVDLKRLLQLLRSFPTIHEVKIYVGTLMGDKESEKLCADLLHMGYAVTTKPVKIMQKSIDVSSISPASADILKDFIRNSLLKKLKMESIQYLNRELGELNKQGILYIEDRKCNFDVEIGRDMLIDYERNTVDNFILWSGDSDFASSLAQLLADQKKVFLFATARRVASELNDLKRSGLGIYDIQKIRDFICWKKEVISK